jgi:flagellar biosynthesis/type III secretory pathway M-ring protein FliF/YscJ
MERVKQIFETIRTQLGRMTATQRLLIGSLAVIVAMTLFLVGQYSGGRPMTELMQDDPNLTLVDTLKVSGIEARVENGRVVVPSGERRRAVAALASAGQLPGDTEILFGNLMQHQDWKASQQHNRQQFNLALQNELGRVIAEMPGVATARVFINAPEPGGLGRTARAPSASVHVRTLDGTPMPQAMVDGIARLIAGPVAGMKPTSVEVIDGATMQPRRVTGHEDAMANAYLEQSQKVERVLEDKLRGMLSFIPGAIVSVTAQVDVRRVTTTDRTHYKADEGSVSLVRRRMGDSVETKEGALGGEPGVRSNQQADIAGSGGGSGMSSSEEGTEQENEVAIGGRVEDTIDPRGVPVYLAASISVPQGYVEQLIRMQRGRAGAADASKDGASGAAAAGAGQQDADAPVEEAELEGRFEELKKQLVALVGPHLLPYNGMEMTAEQRTQLVAVEMLPMLAGYTGGGGGWGVGTAGFGAEGAEGVAGTLVAGVMGVGVETIAVGVLAVFAVVMMLMMVRKTTKRLELPSPEELSGMPRVLKSEEDELFGEAVASETPLEGIEVDENRIVRERMMDQVTELIKKDPATASRLMSRWVQLES